MKENVYSFPGLNSLAVPMKSDKLLFVDFITKWKGLSTLNIILLIGRLGLTGLTIPPKMAIVSHTKDTWKSFQMLRVKCRDAPINITTRK